MIGAHFRWVFIINCSCHDNVKVVLACQWRCRKKLLKNNIRSSADASTQLPAKKMCSWGSSTQCSILCSISITSKRISEDILWEQIYMRNELWEKHAVKPLFKMTIISSPAIRWKKQGTIHNNIAFFSQNAHFRSKKKYIWKSCKKEHIWTS